MAGERTAAERLTADKDLDHRVSMEANLDIDYSLPARLHTRRKSARSRLRGFNLGEDGRGRV
jgi:hypothetical protein